MCAPIISVIIRTYNCENTIEEVIKKVLSQQTTSKIELVIIDSGSTDKTLSIIEKYNPIIGYIKSDEFNYARASNIGYTLATGTLCVSLSDHAIPVNNYWLQSLIDNFNDPLIVGVYSRQIAFVTPTEMARIARIFGAYKIIYYNKWLSPFDTAMILEKQIAFSNTSSCVRKGMVEQYPLLEYETNEEKEWAKKMLNMGYKLVYEPKSQVFHNHNDSILKYCKLYMKIGKAYGEIHRKKLSYVILFPLVLLEVLYDLRYFEKMGLSTYNKLWWGIKSFIFWCSCTLCQIYSSRRA